MRMYLVRVLGLISVYASWVVITGGPGPRASGQDRAPGTDERAERLEEMALIAHSIKVFTVDEKGNEVAADMREEPLQRWTDPTREFSDGGMWVWRAAGRPVAAVGMLKIDTKDVLTLPDKDSGPPIAPSDSYYDVLVPRRLVEVRNRARVDKAKSKEAKP